jgi:hypothetical protein
MLTIKLSQSGLLLYKFIKTHLFRGDERRLGQSAAYAPGTAQHPRTPIEAAPIFPLLPPAAQLVRVRHPTTNAGSRRLQVTRRSIPGSDAFLFSARTEPPVHPHRVLGLKKKDRPLSLSLAPALKQIETSEQATRGLKVPKLTQQAPSETGLACLTLLVSGEARRLLKYLTLGPV